MKYVSTRGAAPVLELRRRAARRPGRRRRAVRARDVADAARRLAGSPTGPTPSVAVEVMWPFVEGVDRPRRASRRMVADAYATFDHPDVVPARASSATTCGCSSCSTGPTLAFKDVALQLVGRLFDHELDQRGERVTIVGATSGDTGSAAIEACRGRDAHRHRRPPPGRPGVSEVQRRQMTTVDAPNVHNVAVEGTFDDCQDLVKAMFADEAFRDRACTCRRVNSINWARVMAQIVYYVDRRARLGGAGAARSSFACRPATSATCSPAGAPSAWACPIEPARRRLATATTSSPASSTTGDRWTMPASCPRSARAWTSRCRRNFERLLFELYGRDGARGRRADGAVPRRGPRRRSSADRLACSRACSRRPRRRRRDARRSSPRRTTRTGVLVDPHTAVGLGAAAACRRDPAVPMVCAGHRPPGQVPRRRRGGHRHPPARCPTRLADLLRPRPSATTRCPNDLDAVRRPRRWRTRALG